MKSPAWRPITSVGFGEKPQRGDSICAHQLLTLCVGDVAYQKRNDCGFWEEHSAVGKPRGRA